MKTRAPFLCALGRTAPLVLVLGACAGRPPALVPPQAEIEAVEGYGTASIQGGQPAVKGRFSFLFRRPGRGRIEASDPFGRTVFALLFEKDAAYFILPSKKVYAVDGPETMMNRFLGFSILPDDFVLLLGGRWEEAGSGNGPPRSRWSLVDDGKGRVTAGEKDGLRFEVREFFGGAGVPRDIQVLGEGTSGRVRIVSLRFNPPSRPEALDASFLRKFTRRTWEEIEEIIGHER